MKNEWVPPQHAPPTIGFRTVTPVPIAKLQKMSQTVIDMWKRGLPIYRPLSTLRETLTIRLFDNRIPTDLQWISDFFEERSWMFDPFMELNSGVLEPTDYTTMNASLSFSIFKALEVSDTPSWFEVGSDLVYALLATRLRGVRPEDVKLPLPGFYVALPPGIITLRDNVTGDHEVRACSISEGCTRPKEQLETNVAYSAYPDELRHGRRLLLMFYCEPNENSSNPADDNLLYLSIPLYSPSQPIEELLEHDLHVAGPDDADHDIGGTVAGVSYTHLELRKLLRFFVVNFLLYLASPESDIQHKHAKHIRALRKGKGKKSRRNKDAIKRLEKEPFWVVGSRVVIDPSVRESVRGTGTPTGKQRAVNVPVMGYWRRQWRGRKTPDTPKGQDWYMRWIDPTVRNRVEGVPILGHEYKIRERGKGGK